MFINFDSLKKGEELRGGVLLPIRITATLAKLIRFNFVVPFVGTRYSSFHAYTRKGKPRVSLTWYVAFKGRLFQKIIKKLAA